VKATQSLRDQQVANITQGVFKFVVKQDNRLDLKDEKWRGRENNVNNWLYVLDWRDYYPE
jgi:hypothetical protein